MPLSCASPFRQNLSWVEPIARQRGKIYVVLSRPVDGRNRIAFQSSHSFPCVVRYGNIQEIR
jgi:hypothetical protein